MNIRPLLCASVDWPSDTYYGVMEGYWFYNAQIKSFGGHFVWLVSIAQSWIPIGAFYDWWKIGHAAVWFNVVF